MLIATTGTHLCSGLVVPVAVVLDLREVGLQSTVPADNVVALDKRITDARSTRMTKSYQ